MTMVNNVIGVINYVIAARPSLRNFMIADIKDRKRSLVLATHRRFGHPTALSAMPGTVT